MAEKPTEFTYHSIELYKWESLGSGSYGGVCKAKCDGLLCAAKIMHPTIFDLHDPGTATYLSKFQEECHLLSLARHPNVVQYLGTSCDPDTRLPVLLMELCQKSLTAFLERSPGPLPHHIEVDISHDIALALVYLHSNGLIHRDLTGNNVLMVAGPRAKITDFGMSKLTCIKSRMTAHTLCPGNLLYMSPEALDEAKSYTAKLDIFSFGVIVVQILTRLFPNPTDCFQIRELPEIDEEVRVLVPDSERRQTHLQLIPDTHSLKPLALQCLKKENERPSALDITERLHVLKQSSQYRESIDGVDTSLKQELGENELLQAKDLQLQETQNVIASQVQLLQLKERELQWMQEHLRASEQLVSEFQQSLQQRDKTIADLDQTISVQETLIHQLDRQAATTSAYQELKKGVVSWKKVMNAPEAMCRGAATVHDNTAYFVPAGSHKVYSYHMVQGKERWSQLPDNPNKNVGLAVVNGLVTSVGGKNVFGPTNTLFSLLLAGDRQLWSEIFPPTPTSRNSVACVTVQSSLVVAGGDVGYSSIKSVNTVEVMNTDTELWSSVSPLPEKCWQLSAAVLGDTIYLTGGLKYYREPLQQVFACSVSNLLSTATTLECEAQQPAPGECPWKETSKLPMCRTTLVVFGGDLLAVGGTENRNAAESSDVYVYNPLTDSWNFSSRMKDKHASSLVVPPASLWLGESFPDSSVLMHKPIVLKSSFDTHNANCHQFSV